MAHVQINHPKTGSDTYTVHWRDSGRFRQRTFTVKRDAERFGLRVEDEMAQGRSTTPYTSRGKTVAQVVEESLAASGPHLKPRTRNGYRYDYDNHVLPALGSKRIAALTSADVERWVADLHASGLAPATVRNTFVALNKACRYAVRHRYIGANPCAGTVLPKVTAHDERFQALFLTPAQVEALAAALDTDADGSPSPYGLIVRVAAYTGLRAGELAALRIKDINTFKREIRVERNVQRIAGEWVVGTPKSVRSTRTVPLLNAALVAALQGYLAAHPHAADAEAALWPGRTQGHGSRVSYEATYDHSCFYRWYFRPAAAALGLPSLRFHDLRHTYASLMFAAGVDVYKVSRWLGHANISTTDGIYAHLYAHDNSAEAARFAAYLSSAPASVPLPTPIRAKQGS